VIISADLAISFPGFSYGFFSYVLTKIQDLEAAVYIHSFNDFDQIRQYEYVYVLVDLTRIMNLEMSVSHAEL
jgi:hypothetical protein